MATTQNLNATVSGNSTSRYYSNYGSMYVYFGTVFVLASLTLILGTVHAIMARMYKGKTHRRPPRKQPSQKQPQQSAQGGYRQKTATIGMLSNHMNHK